MKRYFLLVTLGIVLFSMPSFAFVPTFDIPGTFQAATEVQNTVNNVKESVTQVKQYQKTLSAIGTYKKSVTEFITNQKEKLQEKIEKIENYKKQVEDFKAKAVAYKAEAEAKINELKDYKDEVQNKIDDAKSTVSSAKDAVSGVVSNTKEKVGLNDTDNKGGNPEALQTYATTDNQSVYDTNNKVSNGKNSSKNSVVSKNGSVATSGAEKVLVSTPTSIPTRQAINTATVSPVRSSTVATTSAVNKYPTKTESNSITSTQVSKAQALSEAKTASERTATAVNKDLLEAKTASERTATAVNKDLLEAKTASESTATAVNKDLLEAKTASERTATAVNKDLLEAKTASERTATAVNEDLLEAKTDSDRTATAVNKELLEAKTASERTAAAVNKDLLEAKTDSDRTATVKTSATPASKGQTINNSINKTTTQPLQELKTKSSAQQPARKAFKSSLGYGAIHQTFPLAFASLSLNISGSKGGITENGVLVVPEGMSLYCDLDYESAADEEENMDACLKKINAIAKSKITEDINKQDITNADRDIKNGFVEYIAAAYLEAMEVYNDSMTFKNNMVDPILTSNIGTVDDAWSYAKEVNRILGTRYNALNKLWARSLGVEAYKIYVTEELKSEDTDE